MQKGPSPLEIERKFLIRYPKVSWLADIIPGSTILQSSMSQQIRSPGARAKYRPVQIRRPHES